MHLKRAWTVAGVSLVLAVGLSTSAIAKGDIQKSIRQCTNEGEWTVDERIKGCTFVLQFGRENVGIYRNIYINRAYAYLEKGDNKRALADLTKAIEMNARHADVFFNRGVIYLELEQWDKAIADFDRAIDIDDELAEAYYNRAVAYVGNGDLSKASEDRAKAFKLKPELRENEGANS
jgi:tetratricopeptide (TPR) repeat protein